MSICKTHTNTLMFLANMHNSSPVRYHHFLQNEQKVFLKNSAAHKTESCAACCRNSAVLQISVVVISVYFSLISSGKSIRACI